jgi:hypothetical protein
VGDVQFVPQCAERDVADVRKFADTVFGQCPIRLPRFVDVSEEAREKLVDAGALHK